MNTKDLRIKKCYDRGMRNLAQIARKIGMPNQAGEIRVAEALHRYGITFICENS